MKSVPLVLIEICSTSLLETVNFVGQVDLVLTHTQVHEIITVGTGEIQDLFQMLLFSLSVLELGLATKGMYPSHLVGYVTKHHLRGKKE